MTEDEFDQSMRKVSLAIQESLQRTQENLEREAAAKALRAEHEAEQARLDLHAKRRCYEDAGVIPKGN